AAGQLLQVESTRVKDAGLARGLKLFEALPAHEQRRAVKLRQRGRRQKRLHLLAQRLLIGGRQQPLAAVPPRLAGEGNLQRAPRPRIGARERPRESLTLVHETVGKNPSGTVQP